MHKNFLFEKSIASLMMMRCGVFVKLNIIPCFDQDPIILIKFYEYLRPPSMNSTFLPFLILVRNGSMKELKNASHGGKLEAGWKRCNPAPGCRHKLPKFDKISFTQSIQLTLVHSPQRQILDPLTPGLGRGWGRSEPGYKRHTARREQGWSTFLVSPS